MPARYARLYVATGNPGKVREIAALLSGPGLAVVPMPPDRPVVFPEEDDDYRANAIAKARAVAEAYGEPAVADDSGIEVRALGGRPGPRSARYGGPGLDDAGRVTRLLGELEGVPVAERGARFYCVAAAVLPDGTVVTCDGECPGRIDTVRRGSGGFGYDPVFVPDGYTASLAELGPEVKDAISHRGHAFRGLRARLEGKLGGGG